MKKVERQLRNGKKIILPFFNVLFVNSQWRKLKETVLFAEITTDLTLIGMVIFTFSMGLLILNMIDQCFESRRQLLNAGLFKPIIENVSKFLPSKPLKILDVGTGEGTPLLQLGNNPC